MRSLALIIFRSWVAAMRVIPLVLFRPWRRSMISIPVLRSRFPVGSSARMMAGSLAMALAMATRCCCPADSSPGLWWSLSPRPTDVRIFSAFFNPSSLGTPAKTVGRATFSTAVSTGMRLKVWNM